MSPGLLVLFLPLRGLTKVSLRARLTADQPAADDDDDDDDDDEYSLSLSLSLCSPLTRLFARDKSDPRHPRAPSTRTRNIPASSPRLRFSPPDLPLSLPSPESGRDASRSGGA